MTYTPHEVATALALYGQRPAGQRFEEIQKWMGADAPDEAALWQRVLTDPLRILTTWPHTAGRVYTDLALAHCGEEARSLVAVASELGGDSL